MIFATIKKEILLLSRDIHAVAVLFIMPLAFIVIMSLAMQDTYKKESAARISGSLLAEENSDFVQNLGLYLLAAPNIHWIDSEGRTLATMQDAVRNKEQDFVLHIGKATQATGSNEPTRPITLFLAPDVSAQSLMLIEATIKEGLGKNRLHSFLQQLNGSGDEQTSANIAAMTGKDKITHEYLYHGENNHNNPSSVQQSVPAWLVFAMFFVLVPMSSAMIAEVQLGTLRRLRTMHVSSGSYLLGKIVPFLLINQAQFLIMLAAGRWLMPLLGGEQLLVNGGITGLMLMSLTTSFAATSFALLVSVAARTQEQATAMGGTFNILFAAIGGIMVPKFVMPASMQAFANVSPMSWALDGFLEVILHGGSTTETLPYAASLTIFGIMALIIATFIFTKRTNYND